MWSGRLRGGSRRRAARCGSCRSRNTRFLVVGLDHSGGDIRSLVGPEYGALLRAAIDDDRKAILLRVSLQDAENFLGELGIGLLQILLEIVLRIFARTLEGFFLIVDNFQP